MKNPFLSNQNIFSKIGKKPVKIQQAKPNVMIQPISGKFSFGKSEDFKSGLDQKQAVSKYPSIKKQFEVKPNIQQFNYQQSNLAEIQNILENDISEKKNNKQFSTTIQKQNPFTKPSIFTKNLTFNKHNKISQEKKKLQPQITQYLPKQDFNNQSKDTIYKLNQIINITTPKGTNLIPQTLYLKTNVEDNNNSLPNIPVSPLIAKNTQFMDIDLFDNQINQYLALMQNRQQLCKLIGMDIVPQLKVQKAQQRMKKNVIDSTQKKENKINQKGITNSTPNFYLTKNKDTLQKKPAHLQMKIQEQVFDFSQFRKQESQYGQESVAFYPVIKYQPKTVVQTKNTHKLLIEIPQPQQQIRFNIHINLNAKIDTQIKKYYQRKQSRILLTGNQKIYTKSYPLKSQ